MSTSSFEKNYEKAIAATSGVESSSSFYSMESEGGGSYLITAADPHAKQEFFGWGAGGQDGWRYGQPSKVKRAVRGHHSHSPDYSPQEWHVTKERADKLIRDIKTNPATGKEVAPEKELLKLLKKISDGTAGSHAAKKAAPAPSTATKASTAYDKEITEGITKLAWASYWADEEERKEDGESFSGVDIYDAAPEPPAAAIKWGKEVAANIAKANGKTLTQLFEMAQEAGFGGSAESFGSDLGHETIGSGVNWTDRLPSSRGARGTIKVPSREFFY